MTSTNITSYLLSTKNASSGTKNLIPGFTLPSIFSSGNTGSAANQASGMGGSVSRIVAYVGAILVVALVILLFIHFFITPIFSFHPGTPGIISVPGFDDGILYWDKGNAGQLFNKNTPIETQCFGYSMILDVFIQNPFQFSNYPRILFSRGASERKNPPTGNTLLGLVDNYNLIIALLPDTTDLIVSVLDKDNNPENVIVSNIPTQEPFRLGIVVMEKALEVYMNGKLIKTRPFDSAPKSVVGDIMIASHTEINIAKLRNLKIWNRVITSSELRYATPNLSSAASFGAGPIPATSTSCPTTTHA